MSNNPYGHNHGHGFTNHNGNSHPHHAQQQHAQFHQSQHGFATHPAPARGPPPPGIGHSPTSQAPFAPLFPSLGGGSSIWATSFSPVLVHDEPVGDAGDDSSGGRGGGAVDYVQDMLDDRVAGGRSVTLSSLSRDNAFMEALDNSGLSGDLGAILSDAPFADKVELTKSGQYDWIVRARDGGNDGNHQYRHHHHQQQQQQQQQPGAIDAAWPSLRAAAAAQVPLSGMQPQKQQQHSTDPLDFVATAGKSKAAQNGSGAGGNNIGLPSPATVLDFVVDAVRSSKGELMLSSLGFQFRKLYQGVSMQQALGLHGNKLAEVLRQGNFASIFDVIERGPGNTIISFKPGAVVPETGTGAAVATALASASTSASTSASPAGPSSLPTPHQPQTYAATLASASAHSQSAISNKDSNALSKSGSKDGVSVSNNKDSGSSGSSKGSSSKAKVKAVLISDPRGCGEALEVIFKRATKKHRSHYFQVCVDFKCDAQNRPVLVRQNVARGETQRRILVCTPSEYASDVLLERLAPRLDPETLIRVNHPTRHTPLNPALRRYAPEMNKDGIHAIPDVEELAKRQVIVTTCMNVAFLKCPRKFFATLILDEAGQAFYAEACIPLATLGGGANVVIVGDTKQLGAHVESPFCELRGLGVSLQEELLRQPLYQCHRRGHHNDEGRVARHVVQLLESYRAHPELMEFFSQQWYDSSLVARPDPSECDLFVGWEKLPNRRVPLLFRGVRGEDRYSPESESLDNPLESLEVVRVVVDLLGSGRAIQAGEISVIAPFRRQVMTIRRALRLQGLHDVVVETVDAYQGRESLCVIFSTTLSRPASNLPVKLLLNLTNEKRLNVALSRAKAFQCVIGDPYALLGACSMWRDFLLFCYRRNAYVGCPLPPLATLQGLGPRLLKSKPPSPVIAADDVSRAIARSLGWEKEEGGNNVDNDDDDDDDGDGNDIATDAGVDNDGIGAFPQEYVASAALGGAIRLNDYLAGDDDLITGPRRLI